MIVVFCLLLIGYGIVAYIHIACPEKIGQPHERGVQAAFVPVYNEDGSMFHAKAHIGYRQGLLIGEAIIGLFCSWVLYKIVLYYCVFFKMKTWWIFFLDFGCASAIARLLTHLAGRYVLDYLYIRGMHSTYDFFDLCIGVCIVGIFVWLFPACIRYYRYKRLETKGMGFWAKFKWEIQFTLVMWKMLFRPVKTWWNEE